MSNELKKFIQVNSKFWSSFSPKSDSSSLLIEEPNIAFITHVNAIFSIILNQAKSYKPVWLYNNNSLSRELIISYVSTAQFQSSNTLTIFKKIALFIKSIKYFINIFLSGDILSFKYDRVKYGDIVYDTFLYREQIATIRNVPFQILPLIYSCIVRHESIKKILQSNKFSAVLVSSQTDIHSGVMLRTALRYGYLGYLRAGHRRSTLQCLRKLDDIYDYEYEPDSRDIKKIKSLFASKFDRYFEIISNRQILGNVEGDAKYAFSKKNKLYTDRTSFNRDFKLSNQKKNIFVMLHALNDYPHSHFRWMIFKDYYKWFIETLKFAQKYTKVNWIFKQHPSIKFYPSRDVSFLTLFKKIPNHIIYIDEKKQINTRSLIYCADAILTCVGSAGFELPALGRIPSITAADNAYKNLGFTLEPKNKNEYFIILNKLDRIKKLTRAQQDNAKAAYMYIYESSSVSMSSCPKLSLDDQNDSTLNSWYWQKVIANYFSYAQMIKQEVNRYIKEVAKKDFKKLNSLSEFVKKIN